MSTPSNRASNPAGKPSKHKDVSLDLATCRQMLPLVKSIVTDIVSTRVQLSKYEREQEFLDQSFRNLDWKSRERRYRIKEDVESAHKLLQDATAELGALGLKVTDADKGTIDFPTRINGRGAAFSWTAGEETVGHWHYANEEQLRPIPSDWKPGTPIRVRSEN